MAEAKITKTEKSPYALLDAVGINHVSITGGFWKAKRDVNRLETIPHQYNECERTGRIDNFRRAAGRPTLHPYVSYSGKWGISAKQVSHPIFSGLSNPIYLVSAGLPTHDECCYWDNPDATHGVWLADWEKPSNKVVCAEYTHGKGKIIVVGTGAYFWLDEGKQNSYRPNLEKFTENILNYLGEGPVAFLVESEKSAALSAEQTAAWEWLQARRQSERVSIENVNATSDCLRRFRVLWWHLSDTPEIPQLAQTKEFIKTIRDFLKSGGGIFLSGFAPQYLTVLGLEPTPPSTIRQVPKEGFRGIYFNDSDVYKWMEAAAWSLAADPDPALDAQLDDLIELVGAAQCDDGYLNTYFMFENAGKRWTDLTTMHELYLGGHMIQAAIAHHRATGKTSFLEIAQKWADHVCRHFGPDKHLGAPGHPEVEMALVELYRETGEKRYLDLASFFIENRGKGVLNGSENLQDHLPIRQQTYVTGHAVRQLYLCAGVTDIYAETGDKSLLETLDKQYADFVNTKMYVTGGAGARHEGEAFGEPYELPNDTAYAETCAAIASFMWNWRMLQVNADSRFADEMERALYNGILSGMSLDGKEYFYVNPLMNRGDHRRTTKHFDGCACCPPNLARTFAALPGYIYGVSKDGQIYVHQYIQSTADVVLKGVNVRITQDTQYPWDGNVVLHLTIPSPQRFDLLLRRPAWADEMIVQINGKRIRPQELVRGYVRVSNLWKNGDTVAIEIPMEVVRLVADPRVVSDLGRVAVRRGPVVYCVEQADQKDVDLNRVVLPKNPHFAFQFREDLLGGVGVIHFDAFYSPQDQPLYVPFKTATKGDLVRIQAIPYFSWANREPGMMLVWLPQACH